MRCDSDGKICWCEQCGQIFSPYWRARTSKALHRAGNPTHKVVVISAAEKLRQLYPEKWFEVNPRIGNPAVKIVNPFGAETDGEG